MGKGKTLKLQLLFSSNFQFCFKRYVTNVLFLVQNKVTAARVSCFINEQKESQELLSSYFRCVAGPANKDCASSKTRAVRAMKIK